MFELGELETVSSSVHSQWPGGLHCPNPSAFSDFPKDGILLPDSRMNSHCFNIAHGGIDESPVAAHFTSKGHTETDLSTMIIDRCRKKDAILRKIGQSRWIRKSETSWPSGMNQRTYNFQSTCFAHLPSQIETRPLIIMERINLSMSM